MGLLTEGVPLSWEDTSKHANTVREHGIIQFIHLYHKLLKREGDVLKWGDEVEYNIVKLDHDRQRATLSLRAQELLEELTKPELRGEKPLMSLWRPEYASYMIEGTPGSPYGENLRDFIDVEKNMALRRKQVQNILRKDEIVLSMSIFPTLGVNPFTTPETWPDPETSFTRSQFWPSEGTYQGHPRFKTLTTNIRQRRGRKVVINVPVFKDERTPTGRLETFSDPESQEASKEGHIYMDAMGFGMGLSCLQVTFQATDMSEAETLYDQLAPLCPIFLALTASSPIFRGWLSDVDCRWDIISASVDCRTKGESGEGPLAQGEKRIPKSRYASISSYLSDCALQHDLNDVDLVHDPKIFEQLKRSGVKELMAKHISHLFIRDSVSLFSEKVKQDDEAETDHFENIQSTNWQTMRFKPPPPNSPIGWRVEFRPCELQFTDFENAAVVCFLVLLTRVLVSFKYNLLIPISLVDENMKRSQKRDAILKEKFFFRTNVNAVCSGEAPEIKELTINEIFNGCAEFQGIGTIVEEYLRDVEGDSETMCTLSNYCSLIRNRSKGTLMTNSAYMRKFVQEHEDYKRDSRVSEKISYDLLKHIDDIQSGKVFPPELFKDLKMKREEKKS